MMDINLGQVLTIAVTLLSMSGMGAGFIWAIKANTMVLDAKLTAHDVRLAETNRQLMLVQTDLKKLNEVVTSLALQDQRATVIEHRVETLSKRIEMMDHRFEELRHGEGFVYPLVTRVPVNER